MLNLNWNSLKVTVKKELPKKIFLIPQNKITAPNIKY